MTNRLIAAGNSRLKKAADSAIDPAVPAELQKRVAAQAPQQGTGNPPTALGDTGTEPSTFAGGRVLAAEDIQGSPKEQLAYVTERLVEIDSLGRRAEDFVVLNKGVLLEVAQERELHKVAGYTNFAQWAGSVLDVEEKYVFELLQDAARIRTVGALGIDLAQHLTKASTRKVVAEVIANHGLETARAVMAEGLAEAAKQGKKRPTAAMLTQVACVLAAPTIPSQETRSEISDLLPAVTHPVVPVALQDLGRAAAVMRERVYAPLAPAAVRAAAEADPSAAHQHLERLGAEIERAAKRLATARRTVAAELEQQPIDAEIVGESQGA